ncbi:hypothetical protein Tco_0465478, partial [Tanacetum coccineum]
RGDVASARVIMESLDEFKSVSGLVRVFRRARRFFCNVKNHVKSAILNPMPFSEGTLPVIYLGVPLISSRLLNQDCKFLLEKARNRIEDWKNKSLSFAGRLQLCKSVISSMYVYWASVLMIPKGILLDIQQLMRGFLWCNGELKRGKAKVTWDDICLPKNEGGLGIRRNGREASVWFDMWGMHYPLSRFLTPRDITMEGFTLHSKVADLISNAVRLAWEAIRPRGAEPRLGDIVAYLQPIASKRSATSIIGRLLLTASSYHIWLERNYRTFKQTKRSPEEIGDYIMVTLRLKLLTFKFKNTSRVKGFVGGCLVGGKFCKSNIDVH